MSAAVEVRIHKRWRDVPALWHAFARAGAATPFHTPTFLAVWYERFATRDGVEPVIVEASAADGAPILLLPLVRQARPSRIGFIDEGIVDNGAPILGPAAPETAADALALWQAVCGALPAADLVHLTRMPAWIGDRPNPLALLRGVRASRLSAHVITLSERWEDYDLRRTRHFRKEQRRAARIFSEFPNARFDLIETPDERRHVFAALEALQRTRLAGRTSDYRLDRPDVSRFYAELVDKGAQDGSVVLSALRAGNDVIGALLALSDGVNVTVVRIAHAGEPWAKASPGRLIIEKTMAALHARGIRRIDLSIGEYDYKDHLAAESQPLFELAEPLRLAGWPAALSTQARARLSASPALRALAARLRGRPADGPSRAQPPG